MGRKLDRVARHTAEAAREGDADSNLLTRGSAWSCPTCPKCGGKKARPLAGSDTLQRYECSDLDCMESFAVPVAGALASLADRKEHEEFEEAAAMEKDLFCGKCSRAFAHGKRLKTHEAKCTGGGCACAA